MTRFSNLRFRLVMVTVVFLLVAPTLGMVFSGDASRDLIWLCLLLGALALTLAWFMWSDYFLRQTSTLLNAARHLAAGDFAIRTGMQNEKTELGHLAREIDNMAESLQKQTREREQAERTLLNRTHQQTVIAALGQFALATTDLYELLYQAVNFITQTLELEYCGIWEMNPDNESLILRKGTGWKKDSVGHTTLTAETGSFVSHIFTSGGAGAVAITDLRHENRFHAPQFLAEHGVISGIGVVIPRGTWQFGVLGVFTTTERKFSEDELHFLLAVATVIAMAVTRRQDESELHKLASFPQFNPNPVMEFSADGQLTYFNDAAVNMANTLGKERPNDILPPDIKQIIIQTLASGQSRLRHETRHGARTISWSFFPVVANHVVHCYAGDITDRLNLEAQLRQSQKMESVGQLAAGVAHDFNNMLTIIQGHSGVIMARPNLTPELLDSAQAIYFASERAANLTRQLLMFSRKNIIQPKQLDLRETVGNMTKMLQRMIGEVIALKFVPPATLPPVRGDSGMIEQVIMNLAVNARDAMSKIKDAQLTLTLKPTAITREQTQFHPQGRPGKFICLEVTDTGHGMTPETQARIFEPFFTTKEIGKGTGLGLATVYGIVKQHEGWLEVTSEINKGTTFHVYLPASAEPVEPPGKHEAPIPRPPPQLHGGKETILVVEDEAVLRDLAQLILREQGYRVLEAASGHEALRVWERERASIDLLLTDMVMPEGMSGKELAEQLRRDRADLKVICVSGYSVEDIQEDNFIFLQKPYTRFTLAQTVRDTLDAKK